LIHLIPTAIVFIGFGGFFFDDTVSHFEEYQSESFLFNFAMYVWYYNSPVYYIICLFKLRKHKKNVREYYSYTKNVDLKWLNYLVHGFAAFLIFGLLTGLMWVYLGIELPFGNRHYTWLVMVLYIFGMGYFGYFQKGVSTNTSENNTAENSFVAKPELNLVNEVKNTNLQYLRSGLSKEDSIEILDRLTTIMEIEKPFTNFELNLRELANIVQTTPHKLSQVINEQLNYNFFEFVNNYRIEEVKKALINSEYSDLKIMAIAYDCGFSSKSAFYTIFKKKTSKTPTAYREELIAEKIIS
jgi:AraC-like DNA-binding protein